MTGWTLASEPLGYYMFNVRTVTITDNATGKSMECPVREGTHGKPVVDIRRLRWNLECYQRSRLRIDIELLEHDYLYRRR